ncbi:hypothetical protein AAX26_01116 [Aliarcobacter thereius]|nr:hypothetical protein AAX26_01116 [Aliarcobacter thereius]TLT07304.1 DUF721 domain-containing protein [Aliarcobacter thereius]
MKNINEILAHIALNPNFNKINIFLDIKRFVNILPLKLKSGIKFVYIRNQTMHFVLKHQLFKVEFEHNKQTLEALLKMAKIENVNSFAFFVTNVIEKAVQEKEYIEEKYIERSFAIFENKAKDKEIYKKFEDIRTIIKEI